MMILALLAFIQACILPGWLVLRCFPFRGPAARVVLTVTLSLLVNAQLALLLAAIGMYTRPVLLGIFGVECAAAGWLLFSRRDPAEPPLKTEFKESIAHSPALFPLGSFLHVLSYFIVFWIASECWNRVPGVFGAFRDDSVSWNIWADSWASGQVPTFTSLYPQGMPVSWAVVYIFTGTSAIHIMAKAMMGIFPPLIIVVLIATFEITGSLEALVAAPLLWWVLWRAFGRFWGAGMAEMPFAFAAFAPWLAFALRKAGRLGLLQTVALSTLAAASAAMVKQGGLLLLAIVLVWNICILCQGRARWKVWLQAVGIMAGIAALGVAPWYVHEWAGMRNGSNASLLTVQTHDLHGGRHYASRFRYAAKLFSSKLAGTEDGKRNWVWAGFAVLAVAAAFKSNGRKALAVAAPLYIGWALFYSYDLHNVALAVPYMALAAGVGAVAICEQLSAPHRRARSALILKAGAAAACVFGALWLNKRFDERTLFAKQDELARHVGNDAINAFLYRLLETGNLKGAIVTGEYRDTFLPVLGPRMAFVPIRLEGKVSDMLQAIDHEKAQYVIVRSYEGTDSRRYAETHWDIAFKQGRDILYGIPEAGQPAAEEAPAPPP